MLQEAKPRSGFFEPYQFVSLLKVLPEHLRPVIRFAYVTGWRTLSEILPLQWRQIDLKGGEVRLDSGTTKNKEGRVFPMTNELRDLLLKQWKKAKAAALCPWVFPYRGNRIRSFKTAWKNAIEKAGLAGRIPHDFRRTAVRNLLCAGVPERVAMQLTGYKTRSVFDRYNIVSDGDLADAKNRLNEKWARSGHGVNNLEGKVEGGKNGTSS